MVEAVPTSCVMPLENRTLMGVYWVGDFFGPSLKCLTLAQKYWRV